MDLSFVSSLDVPIPLRRLSVCSMDAFGAEGKFMKNETIIIRSNSETNNLISAFGVGVKETRLTSFLGYLFSLDIHDLNRYFQIEYPIINIILEKKLDTQRCDIVIETTNSTIIIEAKKNNSDTSSQLKKQYQEYVTAKKVYVISLTRNNHNYNNEIISRSWSGVYDVLQKTSYNNYKQRVLSEEFMNHLADIGMVNLNNKEVYARDVNKIPNLSLLLQARVYFCKANDNIYKCSYFAPYFGNKVSKISPGIKEGMSYIAKIEHHVEVNSFEELSNTIKLHMKKNKLKTDKEYIDKLILEVKEDEKYDEKIPHLLLLLGKPRMLFNPPIGKAFLMDGNGFLSKQYYEFEDLFEAARL